MICTSAARRPAGAGAATGQKTNERAMIKGARQLPTMHVAFRVPWHAGRSAGMVWANPRGNTS